MSHIPRNFKAPISGGNGVSAVLHWVGFAQITQFVAKISRSLLRQLEIVIQFTSWRYFLDSSTGISFISPQVYTAYNTAFFYFASN